MKIDELVMIFNEKFNLNKINIVGLDGNTILFKSKNDGYGITWDIISKSIEFFNHGHKIGYIINEQTLNSRERINPDIKQDIIDCLARTVRKEPEIKLLVEKKIKTEIYNEEYETVIKLKDFLEIIS